MDFSDINYLAVLLAVVWNMFLGSVWYSPVLFAKKWMKLTGVNNAKSSKKNASKAYLMAIISSVLLSFVMCLLIKNLAVQTMWDGLIVGFFVWLGLVVATHLPNYIFEKKPFGLFLINAGYPLVSMFFMGVLFSIWI